jgi:hypothetical protein
MLLIRLAPREKTSLEDEEEEDEDDDTEEGVAACRGVNACA